MKGEHAGCLSVSRRAFACGARVRMCVVTIFLLYSRSKRNVTHHAGILSELYNYTILINGIAAYVTLSFYATLMRPTVFASKRQNDKEATK